MDLGAPIPFVRLGGAGVNGTGLVDDPIGEEKVVGESPTTLPCLARQTRRPSGLTLSLQACGAPHPLRWPPKTWSPRRLRIRLLGRPICGPVAKEEPLGVDVHALPTPGVS